ncbi:MAG: peptidase [Acidobacteria bacterium]|nr:peptidase [Acidobacteriota bacterium]
MRAQSNVESPRSQVTRHLGTGRVSDSPLDWKYRAHSPLVRRLSAVVDLRRHCPPVHDQRHLNSCPANVIAAALRDDETKEGRPDVPSPSRLFIYCNARVLSGVAGTKRPVSRRDGDRTVTDAGICPDAIWPDLLRRVRRAPALACFRAAPDLTWDSWTMRRVS